MTVAPGSLGQLPHGDQRGHRRRRYRRAALVDDEAAVGVTVEGQPDVGTARPGRRPAGRRRLAGSSGFASWLGKLPSSSKYSGVRRPGRGPTEPRARCARPCRCPRRRPPAARGSPRGRPGRQVVGVVGEQVAVGNGAWGDVGIGDGRRRPGRGWSPGRCPGRPGVAPARHSLMPLYARRVVARGEHRARQVEEPGGEVQLVGARPGRCRPRRRPGRSHRRRRRPRVPGPTGACPGQPRSRPARHRRERR